jgi:DNA-binding MurR/RpiR family transcriptional regulator
MDIPADFETLKDRLIQIKSDLPKRLQQVAAFALDNPQEMALGTASSIAARAEVQASTLVRFAQAIGFAGFSDLQAVFRSHLRDRWPDYSERMKALHATAMDSGDPTHLLAGFADSANASLTRLRQTIVRADLDRATDLLSAAEMIYLIGQRRAFSVTHYLAYALAQLGVRATLVDNVGSLGIEQAANATRDDALIAVSFAPYTPFTVDMTRRARAKGTPIVVITDSPLSPLAGLADVRFEIAESDFGSFRSLAATFCLAITLAVALAEKREDQGKGVG